MQPLSFEQLLNWIIAEYSNQKTIFGIPERCFYRPSKSLLSGIESERDFLPLGPAAGPHTQMAPNILTAYLCGGRYFELKTVQVLDNLEIAKPCIDAQWEGYNTEWSTELSIERALEEYTKAYILIHFLAHWLDLPEKSGKGFVFNISVGYDLKGIQSPKVDAFIEKMKDGRKNPHFEEYLHSLVDFLQAAEDKRLRQISESLSALSPRIVDSVALSTMHGCPPDEIEAIARYLLGVKGLHTYVKLNPTLLGYEKVRRILDANGYEQVKLSPASFEHDLQYESALVLIRRLIVYAEQQQRRFGLKLSNTLPVINDKGYLPGAEMYLSGAALYPLTINLAAVLVRDLGSRIPISYSGGISVGNVAAVLKTGIAPVTVATDLLKPGGYLRLRAMAIAAEHVFHSLPKEIQGAQLESLARAASNPTRETPLPASKSMKLTSPLPMWDCFIAPCQARCPIHQRVPEYLSLTASQKTDEALSVILEENPLPNITSYICDHQCESKCTRNFYEMPLAIRSIKRIATEGGWQAVGKDIVPLPRDSAAQVAVVGGGPAGMAAAHFLARRGFRVTIFERNPQLGGTVRYLIPPFRLPASAIERDVALLAQLGVAIKTDSDWQGDLRALFQQGYRYIVLAIGAMKAISLAIEGAEPITIEALEFLRHFNRQAETILLGRNVVVVGGGNSAIDAARAAKRVKGVQTVTIVYRRTHTLMPADREEILAACQEGIQIKELLQPLRYTTDKGLICQVMRLGEKDNSGRPRPLPVPNEYVSVPADRIILALGERVDATRLAATGCVCESDGRLRTDPETLETNVPNIFAIGDARRGPATVVEAIADAWQVAAVLSEREGLKPEVRSGARTKTELKLADLIAARGSRVEPRIGSDGNFQSSEGERCLQCQLLCGRCVEVCPNRANVLIPVDAPSFKDRWQVVHLDYLCNACGNCATFCPYSGLPYLEKFTIYRDQDRFAAGQTDGIYCGANGQFLVRESGRITAYQGLDGIETTHLLSPRLRLLLTELKSRFPYLLS